MNRATGDGDAVALGVDSGLGVEGAEAATEGRFAIAAMPIPEVASRAAISVMPIQFWTPFVVSVHQLERSRRRFPMRASLCDTYDCITRAQIATFLIGRVERVSAAKRAELDERLSASKQAAAWAYRMAGTPAMLAEQTLTAWTADSGTRLVQLTACDHTDQVAGWFLRQMNRLTVGVSMGEGAQQRAQVAYSVQHRLRLWATGQEPVEYFVPAYDDQWDARFNAASATIQ